MIKKFKGTIATACALSLCACLLSGCGKDSGSSSSSSAADSSAADSSANESTEPGFESDSGSEKESSAEATPVPEKIVSNEWHENGLVPATPFVSDEYMELAALKDSDNTALAAVMKKAAKGEEVTIVTIGGSITQGTISNGSKDRELVKKKKFYANLVKEWWETRFPDTKINFINAGIGATTSYLGVHRAGTDVLAHEPDLVIVEFAVNDAGLRNGQVIYDNLVRNILSYKSNPAVMLLFMGQTNGSTAQMDEYPVGKAYSLPMISYANVISKMMKDSVYTDKELSGDTVHPSGLGHSICGELFWYYFNAVYHDMDKYGEPEAFSTPAFTKEKYTNAKILDSKSITPDSTGSFAESSKFTQFPNDWTTESGNGEITFTVNCRNLGLIYYRTTDGKSGKFDVEIDGKVVYTLDADFTGGWGNYAESAEVFSSDAPAEHKVVIRKNPESANEGFTILGLLVSGGN